MIRYLDMLDALLSSGLEGLSRTFVDSQISFVTAQQQLDGGFPGRLGASDLYYTDFALRILTLLAPQHTAIARTGEFLRTHLDDRLSWHGRLAHGGGTPTHLSSPEKAADGLASPADLIESFSLLNSFRLLKNRGQPTPDDTTAILALIQSYQATTGGLSRMPSGHEVSAYYTFLGALCYDCLEQEMPDAANAVVAIKSLENAAGAFAELPGQPDPQTNATAAAVAFLGMQQAVTNADLGPTAAFLCRMQLADGGLKAHANAETSDLLSTFTGMLTLAMTENLGRLDVPSAARFVRSTAAPGGGFRSSPDDPEADIEYTFYGLGCLALLRLFAQAQQ